MEGQKDEVFAERKKGLFGEDLGDKKIIVGDAKKPIWLGPVAEAQTFFTTDFDLCFELWRRFKSGLGLPKGGAWADENPDIADVIMIYQEHYEAIYKDRPIISRLDALLQRGR